MENLDWLKYVTVFNTVVLLGYIIGMIIYAWHENR